MKKSVCLFLIAGMLVCTLLGCSKSGADPTVPPSGSADPKEAAGDKGAPAATQDGGGADGSYEIALVLKNYTSPFCIKMMDAAKQAEEDLHIKVNVLAPTAADGTGSEEQAQIVEQTIVQGVDAVVVMPIDSEAIIPSVRKVVDAGIPVINLNTKINEDALAKTFVAIENYTCGYDVASYLAERMEGEGKVFIIEGTTGAQSSEDRTDGAEDAFGEHTGIEIAGQQSANFNRADAMNVVQNLLQAHPDVKAIFTCNDEMGMGAAEAVEAAGLNGQILIGSIDGNADAVEAVKEGKLTCTNYGNPVGQAYTAIEVAVKCLDGEALEDFYEINAILVTADTVDAFLAENE